MTTIFLDRFLPVLYQSVDQPECWSHALGEICNELKVGGAVVQMLNRQGGQFVQQWIHRDPASTANADIHDSLINNENNPRMEITGEDDSNLDYSIVCDEDLGLYRHPRFQAFQKRLATIGHGRAVVLNVQFPEDRCLSLVLHRYNNDNRQLSSEMEALLLRLAPHLKQTVSLYEKFDQSQREIQDLSHSLEQFNTGLLILDSHGNINWLNHSAKKLLEKSQRLSIVGSSLRCKSKDDQSRLNRMLQLVYSGIERQSIGILGHYWDQPLHLLARPLPVASPAINNVPHIALYMSQNDEQYNVLIDDIVSLFGLSPAEARLTSSLCDGSSLGSYASQKGITEGTARIQLKNIFSKLGVNRQADLIRLVSSSVAAKTCSLN